MVGGGQREVVLENKALVLEEGNRGQAIPGGVRPQRLVCRRDNPVVWRAPVGSCRCCQTAVAWQKQ